jgi:hypothetical protein
MYITVSAHQGQNKIILYIHFIYRKRNGKPNFSLFSFAEILALFANYRNSFYIFVQYFDSAKITPNEKILGTLNNLSPSISV